MPGPRRGSLQHADRGPGVMRHRAWAEAGVRRPALAARARLAGLLAALCLAVLCQAQTISPPAAADLQDPAPRPQGASGRPKVALVLSGGGARGFAHLGVLKLLREAHVPIDMVVGTSLGAIVGGAYAAGHTVESLQALVLQTDWGELFSSSAPRTERDFRRREEDQQYLSRFSFGLSRDGLALPRSTFGSYQLEEVLRRVALPAYAVADLGALPVPFRAVATDLVSGELVVLEKTTLFSAMRASMSIPGAFVPVEIDGRLLVDGGLARNLPVDVARSMGADVVIAVNVGTPLAPRERLNSALDVAQQMVNILTERNVAESLAQLGRSDLLIAPDLKSYSFTDFARADEIMAQGETAARAVLPRLRALSVDGSLYAAWDASRTASVSRGEPVRVADVRFVGISRTSPQVLRQTLGIERDQTLSAVQIDERVRRLNATGDFERVDYALAGTGRSRELVLWPQETLHGGNTLRFGARLESDFRSDNSFRLLALHTMTWVNSYAAEWRNLLRIGSERGIETEFYQPLTHGRDWFVSASAGIWGQDRSVPVGQTGLSANLGLKTVSSIVFAGRQIGRDGEIRLGLGREQYQLTPRLLPAPIASVDETYPVTRLQFRWDTLDDPNFPRHGQAIDLTLASIGAASGQTELRQTLAASWDGAVSLGPDSLVLSARMGRGRNAVSPISLGGFLNLSGTVPDSLPGERTLFARMIWSRRLPALSGVRLGLSLETGAAFAPQQSVSLGAFKRALTLLAGTDTPVGPVYLGIGKTHGADAAIYLFLGHP